MQRTNHLPLEALEPRTLFAVFVAGNPNDGGPGSLRDAVDQANANPGPDEIRLPHAQYTLSIAGAGEDANATGDLDVTDDVTITPLGPGGSTIDAAELDRVFDVRGADLTLENLTITGGRADRGGGVSAIGGSLVVTDSVFSDNAAAAADSRGGAIFAESNTLAVTNSQFTGNTVTSTGSNDAMGGAIHVLFGSATVSGSTFTGNESRSVADAIGGAISLDRAGDLLVTDSHFDSNTATGGLAFGGGAIGSFISRSVHVVNSVLENNVAASSGFQGFASAAGGGIFLIATNGVIEGSTITGNLATSSGRAEGGGVYFAFGNTLTIRDSTITGNRAEGPISAGGGVFILTGVATADDDTVITGNSATVGPDVFGPLIIVPD